MPPLMTSIDIDSGLKSILDRQRAAFLRDGPPSLKERRSNLMKLKGAILARQEDFVAALNADFGCRSRQETVLLDLGSSIKSIKYLHHNLRRWMRAERRSVAMVFFPGSNLVAYQPLGVIALSRLGTIPFRSRSRRLPRPWRPATVSCSSHRS
jgi:coniferyl-aldehyde dehydrogenase